MGKLIEVEKFKKDLLENYAFSGFPDLLRDFCSALDSQPPVDAAPVVHGRWIVGEHLFRRCNRCGYERMDDNPNWDTNFCPNCGADLRPRKDNSDG